MTSRETSIRYVSDTARWAAAYRARKSERSDALFKDPLLSENPKKLSSRPWSGICLLKNSNTA
jgi:hypothetical protein